MDRIRKLLPENEKKLFDDIVNQRVLGASKHIQMIGQMLQALAKQAAADNKTSDMLLEEMKQLAGFFKRTRGEASRAITNAINMMLKEIGNLETETIEQSVLQVQKAVEFYEKRSSADIEKTVDYGVEAAKYMNRIMAFDYSSTVNTFLKRLGEKKPGMELYIPESRTINGGYAFVPTAIKAGMKVHFIPDAAIMYYLRTCDGAFFGAETLYADGTAFNTTGSDIVGLVCRQFGIPLYVLTPMIKLDIRPIYGYHRKLAVNDLKERLKNVGFQPEELEQVDFRCPELLPVGGECIKGVITELGIIPASAVYFAALNYDEKLNLGDGANE